MRPVASASFAVFVAVSALCGCAGSRPPAVAPGCDALVLDLAAGTLNGVAPTASMAAVKRQFPCSTGETEEGTVFNYGGGVFFLDHQMFAYTHRDYWEVRTGFRGRVEPVGLSAGRAAYEAAFGPPVREEDGAALFSTDYGCLRVEGGGSELGVHAEPCEGLELPR